ncbi:MAG: cytochrome c [Saprospiraceae bacterium]|nr:cytochrome c [Saprospiraceae bacterium]
MKLLITITFIACVFISFQATDPLKESIKRGEEVYADFCKVCHMPTGEGMKGVFPPLAKADYLLNNREESIKAVKNGQKGEIVVNGATYNGLMAPLGLDDEEVADVMNYILNSWGNSSDKMVTEEEVSKVE